MKKLPKKYKIADKYGEQIKKNVIENKIPAPTFYARINRGLTPELASTKPLERKNPYLKIAEQNDIPKNTYYNRKRMGWTDEEAATIPIKRNQDPFREIAKKNGIDVGVYGSRLRMGWTKEDAATTPVHKKRKKKNKLDPFEKFTHYRNKAIENGVHPSVFTRRVADLGYEFEEAWK